MREVDRKVEMTDNGEVLITRVIEESLTLDELQLRKRDIQRQKESLVNQSYDIKERYDALDNEEKEYDQLIQERQSNTMTTQSVRPDEPIVIGETDTSVTTMPKELLQNAGGTPTEEKVENTENIEVVDTEGTTETNDTTEQENSETDVTQTNEHASQNKGRGNSKKN